MYGTIPTSLKVIASHLVQIPVKSHSESGACRTVGQEKTLVMDIINHMCGMERNPSNFR